MRLASSCYLNATCLFVLLHYCQIVRITDKGTPIYDLYKARLQLSNQVRNVLLPESELFKRLEHFLDFHLVPLSRTSENDHDRDGGGDGDDDLYLAALSRNQVM